MKKLFLMLISIVFLIFCSATMQTIVAQSATLDTTADITGGTAMTAVVGLPSTDEINTAPTAGLNSGQTDLIAETFPNNYNLTAQTFTGTSAELSGPFVQAVTPAPISIYALTGGTEKTITLDGKILVNTTTRRQTGGAGYCQPFI